MNGGLDFSAEKVADRFDTALDEVEIDLVKRKARILFSQEPGFAALKTASHAIKIAEIVRAGQSRTISRSDIYVHPCLSIGASDVLLTRLKDLRATLLGKIDEFVAIKRQRGVRATATSIQEAIRVQQLQTMSRYLPLLEHYLEISDKHPSPTLHPQSMYALLRQFMGELSVFSERFSALGAPIVGESFGDNLPGYDHENIGLNFKVLIDRIVLLLEELAMGPEAGIKLDYDNKDLDDKQYYCASLPEEFFEGAYTRYYLMIHAQMPVEELLETLKKGKLTTHEDMDRLRQQFLFGLKMIHQSVAPEELPQRGGYVYFLVDAQDHTWKQIRARKNIALLARLDPHTTTIRLLPVRRDHE